VQSAKLNNKNSIVLSLQQKCKLSIRNPFDNIVVGEITSSEKKYAVSIPAQSTATIYVPQGTYKSYFFQDMDYNGMITTPIIAEAYEGEYVIWLPEIITKPNLYNEVILK
jgi:DNA/RNA endonuclease G (NUC1)